jgi:hypothetical protein
MTSLRRKGDALFQDIESDVRLVLIDDERWAEANAGLAAA